METLLEPTDSAWLSDFVLEEINLTLPLPMEFQTMKFTGVFGRLWMLFMNAVLLTSSKFPEDKVSQEEIALGFMEKPLQPQTPTVGDKAATSHQKRPKTLE